MNKNGSIVKRQTQLVKVHKRSALVNFLNNTPNSEGSNYKMRSTCKQKVKRKKKEKKTVEMGYTMRKINWESLHCDCSSSS